MIFKNIEEYSECFSSDESQLLKQLNRETNLKQIRPRMLSGHLQGKLLEMISCMIKPERILEIGTFTGYSTICLSKGLKENGKIHSIEIESEYQDTILKYLDKANISKKVKLHIGDAKDIIPSIVETFDLVYIDANKESYLHYYHIVFDKVKHNGFILADNVLWDGKVIKEVKENDRETAGIIEYNNFLKTDTRVENMLLPFRDGLMITMKK